MNFLPTGIAGSALHHGAACRIVCTYVWRVTHGAPSIDPEILERALDVSGERTKKAAATLALQEFIARRGQQRLVELVGRLEWDTSFDCKAERSRERPCSSTPASGPSPFAGAARLQSWKSRRVGNALEGNSLLITTDLILQQLLHGFAGLRAHKNIIMRFEALLLIAPDRQNHIEAAEVRNVCRRAGVQIGTIDALLARLCLRHGLTMLTMDQDFTHAAAHCALKIWR